MEISVADRVMDCSICFEHLHSGPVIVLPCDHIFHQVCLIRWASTSQTCPYCRAEFGLILTPKYDILQVIWLAAFFVYIIIFFAAVIR